MGLMSSRGLAKVMEPMAEDLRRAEDTDSADTDDPDSCKTDAFVCLDFSRTCNSPSCLLAEGAGKLSVMRGASL